MAKAWSLPASLLSTQRTQSVFPAVHPKLLSVPPRPAARLLAALPSRVAPVAVWMGEVKSKLPPGDVHVGTAVNEFPNPYSNFIVCGLVLPPSRHCSPS